MFAWRTALISFVSFAVSMITAALVLSVTESTFNALVFAGLAVALAVVVDDAVIDVDNVRRRLPRAAGTRARSRGRRSCSRPPPRCAARWATRR